MGKTLIYLENAIEAIEEQNQARCDPDGSSWKCYERAKNSVRSVDPVGIGVLAKGTQDKMEFIGQIIDIFEDFLEEKGVQIENPEKAEIIADSEDPDDICILYGTDYDELQYVIEDTLRSWGVVA